MTGLNEVLYGHNSTLTLNFLAFVDFCHNLNIFQTQNHYIKKINLYFNQDLLYSSELNLVFSFQ